VQESAEVRLAVLEVDQDNIRDRVEDIEARVNQLEVDHSDQGAVVRTLKETVDNLSSTVKTLDKTVTAVAALGAQTDKAVAVITSRLNAVVAILSAIGLSILGIAVKLLFFAAGGG
jgi:archaellum component FlaC